MFTTQEQFPLSINFGREGEMEVINLLARSYAILPTTVVGNSSDRYKCNLNSPEFLEAMDAPLQKIINGGLVDPKYYPTNSTSYKEWNEKYPNIDPWVPPFESFYSENYYSKEGSIWGFSITTDVPYFWLDHPDIFFSTMPGRVTIGDSFGVAISSKAHNRYAPIIIHPYPLQ